MPAETAYTNVSVSKLDRRGRRFIIADPPIAQGRLHRRIIGGAADGGEEQLAIDGKPLVYFDTYLKNGKTYTYARHRGTPKEFFSQLDSLIFDHAELRARRFPSYITVENETFHISLPFPLIALLEHDPEDSLCFFKTSLPFGDVSIQFGGIHAAGHNQRISCEEKHTLTKAVESPILGFQAGEENRRLFVPLLTRLHWASGYISDDILESLINDIAPAVVTV